MYINASFHGKVTVRRNNFIGNIANNSGGAIMVSRPSDLNISECYFIRNSAGVFGGSVLATEAVLTVQLSTFTQNEAQVFGGAICVLFGTYVYVLQNYFTGNTADMGGCAFTSGINIASINNTFSKNKARKGAVLYVFNVSSPANNFVDNVVISNEASQGLLYFYQSAVLVSGNATFKNNIGSLFVFNSQVNFTGDTTFEKHSSPTHMASQFSYPEGGAITAFQSDINFLGPCSFINNSAENGGAILATDSNLNVYTQFCSFDAYCNKDYISIVNNTARKNGGGVYLYRSNLVSIGFSHTVFSGNIAGGDGGGIYAISSSVTVFHKSQYSQYYNTDQINHVWIHDNKAERGGGMYMGANAKLYVLQYDATMYHFESGPYPVTFEKNSAIHGGGIFVDDETNTGTCASTSGISYSTTTECFLQSIPLYFVDAYVGKKLEVVVTAFIENIANISGSNLFGGLLDRCTVSPFAEVLSYDRNMSGLSTFEKITIDDHNYTQGVKYIASDPVRLCFCKPDEIPDCEYVPSLIHVQKGEQFHVQLVAVDHVEHVLPDVVIHSYLSRGESYLAEGQKQKTDSYNCTALNFTITFPYRYEVLSLYAEGPCKNNYLSVRNLNINFDECSCIAGFEPNEEKVKSTCECICASKFNNFISECYYKNETVVRQGNYWLNTIGNYSIYPNCPYDYCKPEYERVFIYLATENATDAQCANNRGGLLCGTCQSGFSLSLGSTRCIQCPTNWPVNVVAIVLGSVFAGIFLIIVVLVLNLTVAVGTLNGIIFYANIVAADTSTLLPFSEPNFVTVFISWLNLDIGIDACFFEGMDAYWKAVLQLAFPAYVIVLVVITILLCRYSDTFARVLGRKNPVATLCTMILFSYTKYLQAVLLIGTPPFTSLEYPDGSIGYPWLPIASMKYFNIQHTILFIIGLLLLVIGTLLTMILIFWQCLVKWVKSPRLCSFMEQFQMPYTLRHRYWTGLLLLVRVILYVIVSVVNVSNDPAVNLLAIGLAMSLLLIHAQRSNPIYKNSLVEIIEILCYTNLLMLCLVTLYLLNSEKNRSQPVPAYISVTFTIFLLVVVISHHVYSEILVKIWKLLKKVRGNDCSQVNYQSVNNEDSELFEALHAEIASSMDDNDVEVMNAVDMGRGNEADHYNGVATY